MNIPSLSTLSPGTKVAGIAGKASTFMSTIWVKLILVALAIAALIFVAHLLVNDFQKHEATIYQNGVTAGTAAERAVWQTTAAQNAQAQRDSVVQQSNRQSQAVQNYLADQAATAPKVEVVKQEVTKYAQTDSGRSECLDDGGVQLLLDGRSSLGLVGQTGPDTAASGGVRGDLRSGHPAPVQH